MKKALILFQLLLLVYGLQAQQVMVTDQFTGDPVEDVIIFAAGKDTVQTNASGQADISAFSNQSEIHFIHLSYRQQTFSWTQLSLAGFKVTLTDWGGSISGVVISANRFEEKKEDVAQQITVINAKDIALQNQLTTADVLTRSGEVYVQKSQFGGGSPVLRGFEANKILISVDGVRMNNAIFRGGHLQNVITIDPSVIDRTEIVFGPGSVVYGSDAMGGVIHIRTKDPLLKSENNGRAVSGTGYARLASASLGTTFHADVNLGGKKIAALASFTFNKFSDLRMGKNRKSEWGDWGRCLFYSQRINGVDSMVANDNPELQVNTGYSQMDGLFKLKFQQNDRTIHLLNLQFSNSSDVPRYDRLSEITSGGTLRFSQWYYGPQVRMFGSYTFRRQMNHGFADNGEVIVAYQFIEESRHNRRFGSDNLSHRTEAVSILSVNGGFEKRVRRHEFRYGIEAITNAVSSTAELENVATGEVSPLDTRYPARGSSMNWISLYATHTWEINKKLILTDGLRANWVGLNADLSDTTFFIFPEKEISQSNFAVNGNLGFIVAPGKGWRISLLGSSGFRAPNVDDLAKIFESVPGNVILPNPGLKPEYSWNGELSAQKKIKEVALLEAVGFYTLYTNALTLVNSTFNGQDSILYDGQMSQVTTPVNANRGTLIGGSAKVQVFIFPWLQFRSTFTFTRGTVDSDTSTFPLDHIPPAYGSTGFRFTRKNFSGEIFAICNAAKRIEDYSPSGEDNEQYALPEGTPAWWTINFNLTWRVHKTLQLQAGIENILDRFYRTFASGVSAPGRNIYFTVRANF